jgi:Na+/H+ antiporter NhaD/arsenite permease-like protein
MRRPAPPRLVPPGTAGVGKRARIRKVFVRLGKARIEPTYSVVWARAGGQTTGPANTVFVADKASRPRSLRPDGYNPRHLTTPGGRNARSNRLGFVLSRQPLDTASIAKLRLRPATVAVLASLVATAANGAPVEPPAIVGIPIDFILFALTLVGVALFHHHTLKVAVIGLFVITAFKLTMSPFAEGAGFAGFVDHLEHEWVLLANLLGLLLGFALLSKHFEASKVPAWLPTLLPNDWKGAFVLLVMIFVLSSFLDNIAAALIGGTIAGVVFRGKVHLGYLAAIVAASNAGGSGSVVGDTTTTMMWIAGVSPLSVVEAYIAAGLAMFLFGIPASFQQQRYSPITRDAPIGVHIDWARVFIVATILIVAIVANVVVNVHYSEIADRFPFIGAAVWVALLVCVPLRRPHWEELPGAFKGSIFLLSLVLAASMMPVHKLPDASWKVAMGLGFVSAVFDNIPLTALALNQGGYDWGFVAFAVGFGGSMIWFGSSAGVALSNQYPEAKSAVAYLRAGWHVTVAYIIGYVVMLLVLGWYPDLPLRSG